MKQLKIVTSTIFILAFMVSHGQIKAKTNLNKNTLNFNQINYIEIRNSSLAKSTAKRLTTRQTKSFIVTFNKAPESGIYKFIVHYWVDVYLKNGSKRVFRVNGAHIKEEGDNCFNLGDKNYLKTLWEQN
ncbi:hypothetical protein [Flavobacterium phycosphaerae]|uniref:hypothetical protein n=1 Tax=Flavobacterium phycosphaerae TaxID=2697515 RepID=UPI001389FA61|nr:hypothetical protein [Flavobacterium phycosphaerae]